MGSVLTRPKYANTELGEILTQQYPPLFHSATNVPSFINAMRLLPSMRHLTIRCPGQNPRERYRRDIVDYALISLRIAIERAPMAKLNKLSLSSVHPAAFNYLRHVQGIGSVPSAGRRWKQIKKLQISVESWDFYGPSPGLDHLKVIDDYVRNFSNHLEKFTFAWVGQKGPCPVALSEDPLFAPPRSSKKLFNEVTSPMSPLPPSPGRAPIHFPKLRYLQIRNATMNSSQLRGLIRSHQKTVKEFDFENVALVNNGSWEQALASVDSDGSWSRSSLMTSQSSFVTNSSTEDLPSPSAAVEAASKELLDIDLGGFCFNDEDRDSNQGLSEDFAAERESSLGLTTKLKKKRVRRRHKECNEYKESRESTESKEIKEKNKERSNQKSKDKSKEKSASGHYASPTHQRTPSKPKLRPSFDSDTAYPTTPVSLLSITAPIMNNNSQPVLLQPTVYNPSAPRNPNDGISSVQRNLEQEEAHRLLAEDPAARASALQRAKEAVLMKLSREFCDKRIKAVDAVAACRVMASRDFNGCGVVMEDRRGMSSHSALVPLMFSRS